MALQAQKNGHNKNNFVVIGVVLVAIVLPLTVVLAQRQNDNRTRAASNAQTNNVNPTYGSLGPCIGCW